MSKAWYKHYPSDWRSDKKLRLVSRAARSFWLDCVGVMHQEGTWRLEVNDRPITIKELAEVFGDNPRTANKLLNELIEFNVCTVDSAGFVTSRRVLRDFEKAEQDKSNGRKGGNPSLKIRENDDLGVNPRLKAQKLEPEPYKRDTNVSPKKRATRLPENWFLSKSLGEWALSENYSNEQIRIEAEKFKDYWAGIGGQRGCKLNWDATFRNWIRNAQTGKTNGHSKQINGIDDWADRAASINLAPPANGT